MKPFAHERWQLRWTKDNKSLKVGTLTEDGRFRQFYRVTPDMIVPAGIVRFMVDIVTRHNQEVLMSRRAQ